MKLYTAIHSVVALLAIFATARAQEAKPTDATKAAQEQNAAYVAAFNKGDVKALVAMSAPDAEHTTDSGERIAGRPAIRRDSTGSLPKQKGQSSTQTWLLVRLPPGNSTRPCENTREETVIFCST